MKTVDTTIVNRRSELARVASLVDELAAANDLERAVLADIQVALDEVLSNIIDHGFADEQVHEIRVRLRLDHGVLEATIEDDGKPFDLRAHPTPDLNAPLRRRRVGGLGIHFVRNLMTEVRYGRVKGRNRLVLRKRLTDAKEGDCRGRA
jgi:serine/threonine-protein kinase RsbW